MEASVSASELTFGKIAASTGTGGFLIDRDYLIWEISHPCAIRDLQIAKNENSNN